MNAVAVVRNKIITPTDHVCVSFWIEFTEFPDKFWCVKLHFRDARTRAKYCGRWVQNTAKNLNKEEHTHLVVPP